MISKPHPWHGLTPGKNVPDTVTTFIEMTPYDIVKYEVDKESGYLMVDRPQKFSSLLPALYGFIPRTYCAEKTAEYFQEQAPNVKVTEGDLDPLDVCVLCDRHITHGDILVPAIPIGGFRMLDGGEADDKIVAVMESDEFYAQWKDINDVPTDIIHRLKHYFLSYKDMPGEDVRVQITHVYGREEAHEVIRRSMQDYSAHFVNGQKRDEPVYDV